MKTNPHNHKPMNKQGSDTTFDPHKTRIIDKLMRNFLAAQGPSSKYD